MSADALDLARENAVGHAVGDRVTFETADLLPPSSPPGRGMSLLANLPYVRSDAMASLPTPTTFEPAEALDGGADGLAVIGRLLDALPGRACARRRRVSRDRRGPGRGDRRAGRRAPAGLVVPGRDGPRGPAAHGGAATGRHERAAAPSPAPEFPIRLIALDIDGTLIGDDHDIGPRTWRRSGPRWQRDVAVSLITGRMVSSALRFARELDLTGPLVGYQGGLIRAMPDAGSRRLGKLLLHTPLQPDVAREIVGWTRDHGMDPHVNHLERFILRADDPRADDYSAFMGAKAELVDDLVTAITHPVTKVLAVGEPPIPMEVAPVAARALRRAGGRHDLAPAVPGVRGAGRVEGPRGPLARPTIADPARRDAGDRRSVERPGDAGRGRPRGGDADVRPPRCRAAARYVAPPLEDEGAAQVIEQLVLADPAEVSRRRSGWPPRPTSGGGARRDGAGRGRRCGRPGRRRRGPARRRHRRAPDRHGLRHRRVAGHARRHRAALRVKGRPPDKAVVLLLDDAAQAARAGRITPAAPRSRRRAGRAA